MESTGSHPLKQPLMDGQVAPAGMTNQGEEIRLRFQTIKTKPVFFKDKINEEFRKKPMPESVRKHRNIAIMMVMFQILCCFATIPFYFRRGRVRIAS
jgi:hypothetical protein